MSCYISATSLKYYEHPLSVERIQQLGDVNTANILKHIQAELILNRTSSDGEGVNNLTFSTCHRLTLKSGQNAVLDE